MKVTFAVDGDSPIWGPFERGDTRDLEPHHERKCIERTIDKDGTKLAYLSSSPEAKAIIKEVEARKKELAKEPKKIKGKEDKKNG